MPFSLLSVEAESLVDWWYERSVGRRFARQWSAPFLSLLRDGGASRRWKGVGKAAATFGPSSSRARPTAAWIKYGRDAERCIRVGIATSFNHHVAHICSHLANNHASGGRCLQQTGAFKRCFDQACANVDRDERLMIRSLVLEEQRLLRIGRICSMLDA